MISQLFFFFFFRSLFVWSLPLLLLSKSTDFLFETSFLSKCFPSSLPVSTSVIFHFLPLHLKDKSFTYIYPNFLSKMSFNDFCIFLWFLPKYIHMNIENSQDLHSVIISSFLFFLSLSSFFLCFLFFFISPSLFIFSLDTSLYPSFYHLLFLHSTELSRSFLLFIYFFFSYSSSLCFLSFLPVTFLSLH